MVETVDFIFICDSDDFVWEPTAVGTNDGSQCKVHLNKFGEDATGGTWRRRQRGSRENNLAHYKDAASV